MIRRSLQQLILNHLLDIYERTRAYRENTISRQRVRWKTIEDEELQERLEQEDEKTDFLDSLQDLKQKGLVDFSFLRHEEGNLLESIWLVQDGDQIAGAYREAGRIPKADIAGTFAELVRKELTSGDIGEGSDLYGYLSGVLDWTGAHRAIPRPFFPDDNVMNEKLLSFLGVMDRVRRSGGADQMERVVSARLYGDSKFFEKNLNSKVLSILGLLEREKGESAAEQSREGMPLLEAYGIVRWPEIFAFSGNVRAILQDGSVTDYGKVQGGAYMNARTLSFLDHLELYSTEKILFVENRAVYEQELEERKENSTLVVYQAGFLSLARRRFFEKIREAAEALGGVLVLHWSDIDLGGFRIFLQMREIFPDLMPFCMDVATLEEYRDLCMPIESENYVKALRELGQKDGALVFRDAINWELANRKKLEQEQLIYRGLDGREKLPKEKTK